MFFLLCFGWEAKRDLWLINTQPQPRPHAATAPPRPKQSTTQTHYKITPNNHRPTPDPLQITPTINDTNPGTIAALALSVHPIVLKANAMKKANPGTIAALALSVHPIVLKASAMKKASAMDWAKKKARAMSHGIGRRRTRRRKSASWWARRRRGRAGRRRREKQGVRQRDRVRFERRGLGVWGRREGTEEWERREKKKKWSERREKTNIKQ